MTITHIILDAAPNPMINVILMVSMIAVMYFLLIRPQMKRAKEQKQFSNEAAVGDNIVTTAGIHGKIVRMNEDGTISIEVDRNTILKIEKSAISMEMTVALRKKSAAKTI